MRKANGLLFVEVMSLRTQFLHVFERFFWWAFIFHADSIAPFGCAPRVSHIIWQTLLSIAHHLAYMVHGLCVTG